MNQLIEKNMEFQFLNKINYNNTFEIGQYIGEIYEKSYDTMNNADRESILPSTFYLFDTGWGYFCEQYITYIENGHGGAFEEDIRNQLLSGETTLDEQYEIYRDMQDSCASGNYFFTADQTEKLLLQDIYNGMLYFNMSFIRDNSKDVFMDPENIKPEEWVNPAIFRVW